MKLKDYREVDILLTPAGFRCRVLRLRKPRYRCRACGKLTVMHPRFVSNGASISNMVKVSLLLEYKIKQSMKDVAKRYFISPATAWKIFDDYERKRRSRTLPSVILMDEFSATKDCESKMAFVFSDGLTGEILDILDDRRSHSLVKYFLDFDRTERLKVKHVVMDMNAGYPNVVKQVFPKAEILIDGFHVIQQLSRSFNKLRVQEMNQLKKSLPEEAKQQRKLKKYWRTLLKWRGFIDPFYRKQFPCFQWKYVTEQEVLDQLLRTSETLRLAYKAYQDCLTAFKRKNAELFFQIIQSLPEQLPTDFKKSFRYLNSQKEAIMKSFKLGYSNGKLEGKNNLIKVIKRIAFGFKRFDHLKKRILLQQDSLSYTL
jgi:transposase